MSGLSRCITESPSPWCGVPPPGAHAGSGPRRSRCRDRGRGTDGNATGVDGRVDGVTVDRPELPQGHGHGWLRGTRAYRCHGDNPLGPAGAGPRVGGGGAVDPPDPVPFPALGARLVGGRAAGAVGGRRAPRRRFERRARPRRLGVKGSGRKVLGQAKRPHNGRPRTFEGLLR